MAVVFNTLFARVGRLVDFAKAIRVDQAALRTEFEDTMSNYTDADRDMVKTLTGSIERRIDEAGNIVRDLRSDAAQTIIEMMDDDTTTYRFDIQAAIRELIRQMVAASPETIDRPSAGYVTVPTANKGTAGSFNTGDGIMLVSDICPLQGFTNNSGVLYLDWPSIQTETFRSRCIRDATSKNTPEGQELFMVEGQRKVQNLDEDWPKGTGTRGSCVVASAARDGGRNPMFNVGTNSDFENFTSNVPDNWAIVTGTAGTHIYAAGAGYTGDNALKLVGDGSTTTNIKQSLRATSGSLGEVNPDRPYSITCAVKYATARPTSSLTISVRNSGGTILNDGIVGRSMHLSIASGDIGTSYALFSSVVFAPMNIPKGSVIDIRFSGNQANTSVVFVDDIVIAEMKQFDRGGAAFQMIGGSARYAVGDEFKATLTNNIGTADGELARECERFFQIGSLHGLALPSATSPTIPDSMIS